MIKLLLQHGANPNVKKTKKSGFFPISNGFKMDEEDNRQNLIDSVIKEMN